MVSHNLFYLFVLMLGGQRLAELFKSEAHRKSLLLKGGREHGAKHFPAMAALHTLWLVAMGAEVWLLSRPFIPLMAVLAGLVFLAGQVLRLLAMSELGERWCARIITLPGGAPVTTGIFRYLRHPNYVGVVLEIAAAPLIHTAYLSSLVFSVLNAWLLKVRIGEEERALEVDNNYHAAFARARIASSRD